MTRVTCVATGESSSENGVVVKTATTCKFPLFIFTLVLLVLFSYTNPLDAHELDYDPLAPDYGTRPGGEHADDSMTADRVDIGDEDDVRNFLLHAKAHYSQPTILPDWLNFRGRLSEEGEWRHETMYMLRMSEEGVLTHHAYYPTAHNGNLLGFEDDNGQPVMRNLLEAAKASDPEPGCVPYTFDGEKRYSCAVKFTSNLPSRSRSILVSGLHHSFRDVSFSNLKCPYHDVAGKTSAVDVVDKESLKKFVDEFARFYLNLRDQTGIVSITRFFNCFRVSPWRSGPIYLWWMYEDKHVLFNGLDPGLEDSSLDLRDETGTDVGELIVGKVKDLPGCVNASCEGAFAEYLWDNPVKDGDEVRDENGNPVPGRAPGTSLKIGYFVKISSAEGRTLIVGSGIYPEDDGGGGGCAVAGAGNTPRSAMFSLFLIASALFSAAFWRNRSGEKTVAKSRARKTIFVCALALSVFLSDPTAAGAHGGDRDYSVTAGDVTDMESLKSFVLHAKAHWESIMTPGENIEFENELTMDGDWRNGTIYLMAIDKQAVIFTQPALPAAQNGALLSDLRYDSQTRRRVRTLNPDVQKLIEAADMEEGGCVQYSLNGEQRYSCAVKFNHPVWKTELILIGGYHHSLDDVIFDPVVCPYFVSEIVDRPPYFKQGTGADEVMGSDTLKKFVEEFARHFSEQVEAGQNPAELARVRNCWRTLPWKYGGVYVFIMTESGLVFFNGNTPALENGTINLTDDNGCNVGDEIVNVINGRGRKCKDLGLLPENSEGFVEYLWDDPDDDIPPRIEEGRTPGNVPKLSYVTDVSFPNFLDGEKLIIGSGYHPEAGDESGCSIAGVGGKAGSVAVSLLLTVSVLFSAVLWRNRSRGKQA